MSYNNPQVNESPRAAVGLDKALMSLQEKFQAIEWLQGYVYLRAYKNTFPDTKGRDVTVPEVYTGNGEYQTVLFNDNLPCSLFFYAPEVEKVNFVKPQNVTLASFDRPVSLLFWCNLEEIQPEYKSDYPYTELIKEELIRVLMKSPHVRQIDEYIDDPVEKVFEEFDLPNGRQLGKFPWASMRINFKLKYETSSRPC